MSFKCINPEKLYERDPNLKREDVEILQEWLKKQPHLPALKEMQVMLALHSCYYSVEATKTTIDNYYTIKSICPEICEPLPIETLKKSSQVAFVNILPKNTPSDSNIVFLKLLDFKAENFNLAHLANYVNMVSTLYTHQRGFYDGVVIVFDAKGGTFAHLAKLNLVVVRAALYYLQECFLTRLKEIHVMNTFPLVEKVLTLIKPFLKTHILSILHFHERDSETLYEYVPRRCLPEEYGGEAPSIQVLNDESVRNLLDNYDFFKWHDTQRVDETKRVGKSKVADGVFGLDGTFRRLEID